MRRRLLLLLLLPVLSACDDPRGGLPRPTPISFSDDPRILRGVWTGQLKTSDADAGQTLRFELNATYVNSSQYAVSGKANLGAQAFDVEGTVAGGSLHSYLRPQTSPPFGAVQLNLRSEDGQTVKMFFCDVLSDSVTEPSLRCYANTSYQSFQLKRDNV